MRITKDGDVSVSAPYGLSKAQVTQFVESNRDWIEKAMQRREAHETQREAFFSKLPLDTKQQQNEAMERLHSMVSPWIVDYQRRMGVRVTHITYRNTRTRWGSCNHRTGRINLSLYLLLLPELCIEHVVAHELTHLLVPNHSPQFYDTLGKYFPRYQEARSVAKATVGGFLDADEDL
ncbi:MAG: M48 family metallopeptidase [Bacteroidales bacterium]|nr:M48 family metallopeptidase [Bacteroidales bacterium]MCD8393828.1 M48 family metallopeptidase [Bacteroidales bacterium]